MFLSSWLRNQLANPRTKRPVPLRPAHFRPGLEILEGRAVPAVLNVTTALDTVDPNDGQLSLREALVQANALPGQDTIAVPAGTYLLNGSGELAVTDHVTILGAGAGATVLDGGGAHRVFHLTDARQVTISGVTIQGGVTGFDDTRGGGGILSEDSDLTIDCCTLSGNFGGNGGGGIAAFNGTVTVTHSRVSGCSAFDGGGIWAQGTSNGNGVTVTVQDSTVSCNSADSFGLGGGIFAVNHATLTIDSATISDNSAAGGGGIDISQFSTLTVMDSTLSGNSAGSGGGIRARDVTTVTIKDSTLSGSSASFAGGGIYGDGFFWLTVDHSTVCGCSAGYFGGGIFAAGILTVKDSAITGSSAGDVGGGIALVQGALTVKDSTISGSSAAEGGGLYAYDSTAEVDHSTLNDLVGGGIFNDNSTIRLKQTEVDGLFYKDQDFA
jgi:hypothetical protein